MRALRRRLATGSLTRTGTFNTAFQGAFVLSALFLAGCGAAAKTYVHTDNTTLGRVVVYRNGVAYFERYAEVNEDSLKLSVPADKVDDFLKSLTVVDAQTGKPTPVSYPTSPEVTGTGLIDMKILLSGQKPHHLKLSYVTEAPAWKPSYRVALAPNGKIDLQAWAIVDNTSGEDWKNVRLGVGASSAMSFRFDLKSVLDVPRETLQATDLFAMAPPIGGSVFFSKDGTKNKLVGDLSDDAILREEHATAAATVATQTDARHNNAGPPPARDPRGPSPKPAPVTTGGFGHAQGQTRPASQLDALANAARGSGNTIVIEGYANKEDSDKGGAALQRANRVREQLIRQGVDPNNVVAIAKGEAPGKTGGVRIIEQERKKDAKQPEQAATPNAPSGPVDPIGTSHFESGIPMSLARQSSAMISILHTETEGEVVYLYDADSPRGNSTYPFRAVRLKNPTDSALESGPVSVFGDGRFIGEGLSEPIPGKSVAFVPFALDRQVVVEKKDDERDEIAKIITVQRGVFSTEVQHTRKSVYTLHNRLQEKATVYVRHTVPQGYKLSKSPNAFERVGTAHLFRIDIEPQKKVEVVIESQTPLLKTTDVRSSVGMELVKVYLSSAAEGPLKGQVQELLKLQQQMGNVEQQISTAREQMEEYRTRMDELHAQIVTLRAVKTAGPLMQNLEKKLQEVSDRLSKATVDLVALQEKLMVTRIRFQDGVADLSLEKRDEKKEAVVTNEAKTK